MPFTCSVCGDPKRREFLESRLRAGRSYVSISRESRSAAAAVLGITPLKYETIHRHLRHANPMPDPLAINPIPVPDVLIANGTTDNPIIARPVQPRRRYTGDLPTLIVEQVTEQVVKGRMKPTIRDGMQAQQIIERRAEKSKDRELSILIARLFSSQAPPQRVLPEQTKPRIIDGRATVVMPLDVTVPAPDID